MTLQERSMLQDFLGKLTSVHNIQKDPEADNMIKQAMLSQPDAGYVLVQNILLMQHSLTELNARISELEARQAGQNNQSSFLGAQNQNAVKSYFGNTNQQSAQSAQAQMSQPQMAQPQQQFMGQQQSSGFGDFMRSAGTTAAGVAGGMLLFEGVSHLFGGGCMGGGFGGHSAGGFAPTSETTINNYYSEPSPQADSGFLGSSDIDSSFDGGGFDSGGDDLF